MFGQRGGFALASSLIAACVFAQSNAGELQLAVLDGTGAGVAATADLLNESAKTHQRIDLAPDGRYSFRNLPFGFYRLVVTRSGFARSRELIEIRSAVPQNHIVTLGIQPIETTVTVRESDTLLDPSRTGAAQYIGSEELQTRASGLSGRGLLDLVAMQPGWSFEANGILHPRESEYNAQFVVNGFPVYDNRSPAFAPTVDADEVESVRVYTSGIPAEFGQKLGGVIEVNTQRNTSPGLHGTAVAQGGSFGTAAGFLSGQYVAGRTTTTLTAEGFSTDHYLDPPVVANYTNHASSMSATGALERDLDDANRIRLSVAHRGTWFLVPDDLLQQAAGQRQDRLSEDTEGQASYQHILSPSLVGSVRVMVRDMSARLWSNPLATPISAHEDRGLREGYIQSNLAGHHGRHEWKVGIEARDASLQEQFGYHIVHYDLNGVPVLDGGLPPTYEFTGKSADREQAAYAQDRIRLGDFTISAGIRFDHYRLLVAQAGFSPRIAMSWHSKPAGLLLHASYDRAWSTPPFENLLVSASPSTRFGAGFYLPLRPSRGDYYEAGFTKALGNHVRLDASYFLREVRDFEDDDLLLNTGVSFPIAFQKAAIRGTEAKLEMPGWGRFSGYLSYANTIGIGQFPISGGLFLDDGARELLALTARFPISQDQRNMARGWLRCQLVPRVWTAWSATYNSGLPVEDVAGLPPRPFLLAQYGAPVVARVNFDRGRVSPSFAINASIGAEIWRHEKRSVSLQADVLNLTDRLNVINFAGLLSGTAVMPPRGFGIRLRAEY